MHHLYGYTREKISIQEIQELKNDFRRVKMNVAVVNHRQGFFVEVAYADLITFDGEFSEWFPLVKGMFAALMAPDRILVATPYTDRELDHTPMSEDDLIALVKQLDLTHLWAASSWMEVVWLFVGSRFAPDGVPSFVPRDKVEIVESGGGFWLTNKTAHGLTSWDPDW